MAPKAKMPVTTGGDMGLPYLDVKDADIFEAPDYLCGEYISLARTVAATLVKIKVMLDLEDLATLNDLEDGVKEFTPRSTIVASNRDLMDGNANQRRANYLAFQIGDMYEAVDKYNKHFWKALVNPGRHLGARPGMYSRRSVEEMQIVLNYCYAAWVETPGALEWLQAEFMDEYV
jgi:hypothetical protein